jgi:hypothetical protein
MQGKVAAALPEVEARLVQVEAWWQQDRSGQPVPEAPDAELLARALISALNIAIQAHFALEDRSSALRRIDAILEVKRALERPVEDIGATRFNRAIVLVEIPGRFGEAKAELEACMMLFQNNPADRAVSHNNLAAYLEHSGTPSALAESSLHQLAALLYRVVAGLGQDLQTSLRNYSIDSHRAHAAGTALTVPRVAELLADPAFAPLEQWLRQRQVNVAKLQADVDQLLEQARQAALSPPEP